MKFVVLPEWNVVWQLAHHGDVPDLKIVCCAFVSLPPPPT